jgi:hypothetical protein
MFPRGGARVLQVIFFLSFLQMLNLWGHDAREGFVQHRFQLEVSPQNIDLHLELNFPGQPGAQERLRMDLDSDGHISPKEEQVYLREMASAVEDRVRITVGVHRLPTLLLFYPRVNLLENRSVETFPLTIQISFFARTPSWFSTRTPVLIESTVLESHPAIHSVQVRGKGGIQVRADPIQNPVTGKETGFPFSFTLHALKTQSH